MNICVGWRLSGVYQRFAIALEDFRVKGEYCRQLVKHIRIGHFRVALNLIMKARLSICLHMNECI